MGECLRYTAENETKKEKESMEMTLRAIYIALQIAPLLALLLILPHTVLGYARHKSLNVRRSTYSYLFVLYAICAYFMTMLPLPSEGFFDEIPPLIENMQLIPFNCFFETNLLRSPVALAVIVFNLILTVPLGFFMRFLFGAKLGKTVLAGFLTSLLYELTQLTGLFFIYPAPYRLFDVDDLIINTLGALVGYLITPLAAKLLPSMRDSGRQLVQGSEASFFQRGVATFIDLAFILAANVAILTAVPPLREIAQGTSLYKFPMIFGVFTITSVIYSGIFTGGTLGHRLTGLRLLSKGALPSSRVRTAARSLAVYAAVVGFPFWVYFFMTVNTEYAGAMSVLWVFLGAVLMMCASALLLEMTFNAVTHGSSMPYDRLFGTYAAYSSSKRSSMFGIRVIDVRELNGANIDVLSEEICSTLLSMGVSHESATRVRLMAEGVMLDWIEAGLGGTSCELRLDKRYRANALLLSVSGEDKTNHALSDGYAEMLSGLDLKLSTYYAAEKNICNIIVP